MPYDPSKNWRDYEGKDHPPMRKNRFKRKTKKSAAIAKRQRQRQRPAGGGTAQARLPWKVCIMAKKKSGKKDPFAKYKGKGVDTSRIKAPHKTKGKRTKR